MPQLHLLLLLYDLLVYDFPYDFFGIVGGYKLQRMCYVSILYGPLLDCFHQQTELGLLSHTEWWY